MSDINNENIGNEELTTVEQLQNEIEELKNQNKELEDAKLRVIAEYENYKRRTGIDLANNALNTKAQIFEEIIPVIDNFELALNNNDIDEKIYQGLEMIHSNLLETLKSNGVVLISEINVPNDPTVHMAIEIVESDDIESDNVIEILQKGYKISDKLIRPAMVKISK